MAAMLIRIAIIEVTFANRASFLADTASDFANSNCSFKMSVCLIEFSNSLLKILFCLLMEVTNCFKYSY